MFQGSPTLAPLEWEAALFWHEINHWTLGEKAQLSVGAGEG